MLIARIASSVVQRQVKYVTPVPVAAARGELGEVYSQVAQEMGLVVPPVQLHSVAPRLAAAYWALMREPMLPTDTVDRAAKEAVATVVSVANICPYCVDMHSVGMYDLATEHDAEALVADRVEELDDPRVRAIAAWARTAAQPDDPAAGPAPFAEADRPELVGVLVSLHYLTRMVNVFLSSFLLPPGLGPAARRRFKRGVSRVLRPTLRDPRAPGRSLPLLPHAPLPPDAAWATGNPVIAAAVARSYAAFDDAGQRALSAEVRELVQRRLDTWRGEETGLSRQWCERLIAGLAPADQAAARLALLTALASYQVDAEVVDEFRAWHSGEAKLVEATAWASCAAARRVGAWHLPAGATLPSSGQTA
ncbi:carboxymuconolactone decarboxylase family protein [Catellatospora sp. KI3]|uniref:carboxymuconolactone decarboxylase family protein n=1 Tax=Catellatospora sp. KI3 TaxID=3041620 RepID=UPI00248307E2|nr:carboxymuconolactone decarboxylase family protein [Catellatospora sp. KI3]MDI1461473.1 carboxymuconolactone decarboxylase family protein [Catellatospora sp. KI3]